MGLQPLPAKYTTGGHACDLELNTEKIISQATLK
jgi:hypothetical protein